MPSQRIPISLRGGDRRSIGRSNEVVKLVLRAPQRFAELMRCLWSDDPIVRLRAADAAEKVSALKPELLKPYKAELLGLLAETDQIELRWHLAQMIPRLPLTQAERKRATQALQLYLEDQSSIVRTCALQALADLSQRNASLRLAVRELLEECALTGTAAMKARARKLLKGMKS
jgi:HEAT repeat protein